MLPIHKIRKLFNGDFDRVLSTDIETFSSVDIKKAGAYKYIDSPDFSVLLFAYSYDLGETVHLVDLAKGEQIPTHVIDDIFNPKVVKTAWNATFERTAYAKHFGRKLGTSDWRCTQARAVRIGLPLALGSSSEALGLEVQKDTAGKSLISYFCVPCKATIKNGGRTRNYPHHDPDKWTAFGSYNIQDVKTECAVLKRIWYAEPALGEQKIWELDQIINARGIQTDTALAESMVFMDEDVKLYLRKRQFELTGAANPSSGQQIKKWLSERFGYEIKSLNKKAIPVLLDIAPDEITKEVITNHQYLAKSSVSKYARMLDAVMRDGRIRGTTQYWGANTGRWAGRIIQPHNLPATEMKAGKIKADGLGKNVTKGDVDNYLKHHALEDARNLVLKGNLDRLRELYENIPAVMSSLIRTALVAKPGHVLTPCDYSAIEARVLAWVACCEWRLEVFRTHGKIYEASAAKMFKIPIEEIGKDSPYRKKGKVGELALGYQGSEGALRTMGATEGPDGLSDKELKPIVDIWRKENSEIVDLWKMCQRAAIRAVSTGERVRVNKGISFFVERNFLYIQLPSGRKLAYFSPKVEMNEVTITKEDEQGKKYKETFLVPCVTYLRSKSNGGMFRVQTYGGKLVENIVQAISRDILALAIGRLEKRGIPVVLHVHDEIIPEVPEGSVSVQEIEDIMSIVPSWATGLPLSAVGFETKFYMKD